MPPEDEGESPAEEAAVYDGFLLQESAIVPPHVSAWAFYDALLRRVSIPLPLDLLVIEAAQIGVLGRESQLTRAQEADFYLLVAISRFAIGHASRAEQYNACKVAADVSSVNRGGGLDPARIIDQLGILASTLIDAHAHERAARVLADAHAAAGLAPIESCDDELLSLAIDRLLSNAGEPVLDLHEGSSGPAVPTNPETVAWLRQLDAELASLRGDFAMSVCLYQALACFYTREGDAFMITAADVLSDGPRAQDACRLIASVLEGRDTDALTPQALLVAAKAHLGTDDSVAAAEYYNQASALLTQWPNMTLKPELELVAARVARGQNSDEAATGHYEEALRAAWQLRAGRLAPDLDDVAMREVVEIADEAIDHCLHVGDDWTLAWVTDIVKSARLTALLDVDAVRPLPRPPEPGSAMDLAAQLRMARRRQITEAGERIGQLGHRIAEESDPIIRAALVEQLSIERRARDALLGDAVLEDGLWRSVAATPPRLDPDSLPQEGLAILSLYTRPGEILSTLIVDGECRTARVPLSEPLVAGLRRYTENLASPTIQLAWRDPSALGLRWEDFVPEDVIDALLAASTLVVVPHRDLHLLPWGMVQCRGKRMVEHVDIAHAPNISSLRYFPPLAASPPRLATFCPATGVATRRLATEAEVTAVRAVAGEHALEDANVTGADADTGALASMLLRPDVEALHIASHGWASEQDPLGAGIVFDDGLITQHDLFGVATEVREVFASACLIGWQPQHLVEGQPLTADEGLGLVAAFAACGATGMVASVTLVDDESSAALATHYYHARYAGSTAFHAWCAAMRQMLASDHPPSAWCGYVYFGGVRELTQPGSIQ